MKVTVPDHINLTNEERIGPELRVWWIPQIGIKKRFQVLVNSFAEAKVLIEALAHYDLFQLANCIKPDYSNVGGVEIFEDGEWTDWETEDCDSIDEINLAECCRLDREFYNQRLEKAAESLRS